MKNNYKKGQAMLLSVILITTAVLGMATLVGSLMIYEIRYSYDVVGSAKALYAADAGLECAIYKKYVYPLRDCGILDREIELSCDGANCTKYRTEYNATTNVTTAVGTFGSSSRKTARSFEARF